MMNQMNQKAGSALLLTIMIISLLTTISLGGAAVRYQQFATTDAVNNSAVAKLAAESGVADLKSLLTSGETIDSTRAYDLTRPSTIDSPSSVESFKPTPRDSVYTIEPGTVELPRCLAVGVLNPWLDVGKYAFADETTSSGETMIFQVANIVNDTQLKDIPGYTNSSDPNQLISSLTKMGHFYNPNSPVLKATGFNQTASTPNRSNYWTIKYGGPADEFLTKKSVDGASLYKNLDFIYIPYLPRFVDSAIGTTAKTATQMRQEFESAITSNNLKVWIDANVSDDLLYSYGLGDLFVDNDNYRIKWLQPTLWNDLPEGKDEELMGPYMTSDITGGTVNWTKPTPQLYTPGPSDVGWDVDIIRGSKIAAYLGGNGQTFDPGPITLPLYGSAEGLRVNSVVSLYLVSKDYQTPVSLIGRSEDQGMIYNATITKINLASYGQQSSITLSLSNTAADTPQLKDSSPLAYPSSEVGSVGILANPQPSVSQSFSSTTLMTLNTNPGYDVTVPSQPNSQQSCAKTTAFASCVAVGDIVSFSKSGSRLWGVVDGVTYNVNAQMISFSVDKLRNSPKPIRDFAHTTFTDTDGHLKIAIYGGKIDANSYDGGVRSENNELWFYDTTAAAGSNWQFIDAGGSPLPPRSFGSSLANDPTANKLALFGGSYHEFPAYSGCKESGTDNCVYTDQINKRIATRYINDTYVLDLTSRAWTKSSPTIGATEKIANAQSYRLKVVSTLKDRSGVENQTWNVPVFANATQPITLNLSGPNVLTMSVMPSGLAAGDKIFLFGSNSANYKFRGWGTINAIDFSLKTVNISIGGVTGAVPALSSLSIQPINRSILEQNCTGAVVTGPPLTYYCATGSTPQGVSLGDQVVLENYSGSPINQLNHSLTGYVTAIDSNNIYFSANELDGTNGSNGDYQVQVTSDSAVKLPPASRGGKAIIYDPDGAGALTPKLVVWQGGQKDTPNVAVETIPWVLDYSHADPIPAWGTVTTTFSNVKSAVAPAGLKYGLQLISYPDNRISFLDNNNVNGSPPTKIGSSWNDTTATWSITTTSATNGDFILNLPITLEKQDAGTGQYEIFHGLVKTIVNNTVTFNHDPGYPLDTGIASGISGCKLTAVYSKLAVGNAVADINVTATDNQTITKTAANNDLLVFPAGSIVALIKISGSSGGGGPTPTPVGSLLFDKAKASNTEIGPGLPGVTPAPGLTPTPTTTPAGVKIEGIYMGKIATRTLSGNNVTITAENRFVDSPIARPDLFNSFAIQKTGTDYVSLLTYDSFNLKVSGTSFSDLMPGSVEWVGVDLRKSLALSQTMAWTGRVSKKDTDGSTPISRQDGAGATYVDQSVPTAVVTKLYWTGGTYGSYASIWKEDQAGQQSYPYTNKWTLATSPDTSVDDLPNLFGGALEVYYSVADQKLKGFYFGGKRHFDAQVNDKNTSFGSKVLTPNEGAADDKTFTITNSTDDAYSRRIVNGIYDANPSSNQSKSFWDTRPSPTSTTCSYVGQQNCAGQQIRHLGDMGRSTASNTDYGGYGNGTSLAVINPGYAYRVTADHTKPTMILSGPSISKLSTTGRYEMEGYYPYNNTASTLTSDKTLMLAGFARLNTASNTQGGSILITPAGVGKGFKYSIKTNKIGPNGTVGYCRTYTTDNNCSAMLGWLPDPEDTAFLLNASQALSGTDTYRVIGYYGGSRRAFLVNYRNSVFGIQEALP